VFSILRTFDPTLGPVVHNLGSSLPVLGLALVLGVVLNLIAIKVSPLVGIMKRPHRERDIHTRSTPLLGGVAIYLGFAVAVLVLVHDDTVRNAVLLLCGAVCLFYLIDDRFELPYLIKLAFSVGIGVVAALGFGFQITHFSVPLVGTVNTGWFALPLTLFWLAGMQNTINLIDGVNGLAGGVVLIVALTLMLAAASIGQHEVVLLAAALVGTCAAFLIFNFDPARIFMGDSGAFSLGMALGLLSIIGVAKTPVVFALAIPLLALAVPIADTAWSIIRRRVVGFGKGDAHHLHHRLLDLGLSQRETCLVFYGAAGILGAVGLTVLGHKKILGVAIILMVVLLSTAMADHLQAVGRRIGPSLRFLLGKDALR
jgi:UDP-GlcNAc:undecaprenyl-phosphate GlcNAc-1-phosphate transferase